MSGRDSNLSVSALLSMESLGQRDVKPGRNRQDRARQRSALVAQPQREADREVAADRVPDAGDALRPITLLQQPDIGSLDIVELSRKLVLRSPSIVEHQRSHTGGLGDVRGGLSIGVHRGEDSTTHVVVQQHSAGVTVGGDAPECLHSPGIHLGVGDAFGLLRRHVDGFDDVANGRQVQVGIGAIGRATRRESSRTRAPDGLSWFTFRDAGGMMPTLDSRIGGDTHTTEARLNVSTASSDDGAGQRQMVRSTMLEGLGGDQASLSMSLSVN